MTLTVETLVANPAGHAVVIGAGPAGLMAAQTLQAAGVQVDVYDRMPSVGRKFLLAGKGGLNLTHSEPLPAFLSHFGARESALADCLQAFGPDAVRAWALGLGSETFVGTSGRVFPTSMKAAPLLRAWLHRLRFAEGLPPVRFHMRHRWTGWAQDGALLFDTASGSVRVESAATVLALGGGSWARLGSDGAWVPTLRDRGIDVAPLRPSNSGFDVGWSEHFSSRFAGLPFKSVALAVYPAGADHGAGALLRRKGEFIATQTGVEGSLVYAASALLRDQIEATGAATLWLDLLPHKSPEQVLADVRHPRGSRSLSSHLKSRLGLEGIKSAVLHERLPKADWADAERLARAIKALPVPLTAARPLDEAISTDGGVRFEGMNEQGNVSGHPGLFFAGEMLDWEAPTGGYLLTACLATGHRAGAQAAAYLAGL